MAVTSGAPAPVRRRRRPLARVLRWLGLGVAVVLALAVLAYLATAGRVWWYGRQDHRPASEVIVVMGASQFDGRPSRVFEERLGHARDLYLGHVAPRIMTIGGNQPGDRFTEAQAGRLWLTGHGVPASAVVAVPTGNDTLQSARAAAAQMHARGWTSAVLVTDRWHALRSATMLADQQVSVASSPVTTGPSVQGLATQVWYIGREAAGLLYYQVTGNDSARGPGAI